MCNTRAATLNRAAKKGFEETVALEDVEEPEGSTGAGERSWQVNGAGLGGEKEGSD